MSAVNRKRVDTRRYILAEALLCVALLVYIIVIRSGSSALDVPIARFEERFATLESGDGLIRGDANSLLEFFSLSDDMYEEAYYLYSESGLDTRQLLVIKCASEEGKDAAVSAVSAYNASQMKVFADYAPEQYALLKRSVILGRGNYCFYAVSENAQEWEEVFLSLIRKG